MSAIDRPRGVLTTLHAAALGIGALPALALGQQAVITDADIARVQREQPTVTDADIDRARQRHALPPQRDPLLQNVPRSPDLEALPLPHVNEPLDLGAVAEGFQPSIPSPSLSLDNGPALYLLVSLSMPEPALRRLIAQAAQARATMVIRGLSEGSLRQTAARLQALIGDQRVSIQIDPRPFETFDIQQVPAFVLANGAPTSPCGDAACRTGDAFVRIRGDVSLDYALAYVQRTAPAWAPAAAVYLQRLER